VIQPNLVAMHTNKRLRDEVLVNNGGAWGSKRDKPAGCGVGSLGIAGRPLVIHEEEGAQRLRGRARRCGRDDLEDFVDRQKSRAQIMATFRKKIPG